MDKSFIKKLYEEHHTAHRVPGFSILKEERGKLFSHIIGKGMKVLDLGCRDGALTRFFIEGNDVLGVDVDANALARARNIGIKTMEMDIYGDWAEIRDSDFDVVVAGEVLEHLFHPEQIVEKVMGRLKHGGIFICSVPNAFSLKNRFRLLSGRKRFTPLADPTHINHFSEKEMKSILLNYFGDVQIVPLGKYAKLDKFWPGMFSFDLVFICR